MGIRSLIAFPRNHPASASEASGAEREAGSITTSARWLPGFPFHAPCAAKRPHGSRRLQNPCPGAGQSPPPTILPPPEKASPIPARSEASAPPPIIPP